VTFNGELNASVPGETPAIGAMPVPFKETVNVGFAGSLLEIVNTAVLAPVVVGVKVTLIVQFAPAARVAPQVAVCAKLPGFSPVSTILLMVNGAVPALIRVTVLAALVVFTNWPANVSEVGDTPAIGAMPVPLSVTVNVGFAGSLLEIVSPAVLVPMAVGLKVTLIVQFEPAARLAMQVVVHAKSPGFVPPSVMLLIASGAVPVLESVTS
jgi:hypothetical protein